MAKFKQDKNNCHIIFLGFFLSDAVSNLMRLVVHSTFFFFFLSKNVVLVAFCHVVTTLS